MLMPRRQPSQFENLRLRGRFEVTVLVEHVVGGQQHLVKCGPNLAVAQQHGAIEQRPAHGRRIERCHAHQQRRRRRANPAAMQAIFSPARRTKPSLISRSRGRYPMSASSDVTMRSGLCGANPGSSAQDQIGVAIEIARRGIDLE